MNPIHPPRIPSSAPTTVRGLEDDSNCHDYESYGCDCGCDCCNYYDYDCEVDGDGGDEVGTQMSSNHLGDLNCMAFLRVQEALKVVRIRQGQVRVSYVV